MDNYSRGDEIRVVISNPKRWRYESAALNMPANLEKAVATGLEKISFHSNPKERECQRSSNYCIFVLISHASKGMLKIPQASLKQYVNWELPEVQAGFRKDRGTKDRNCQHPLDNRKSKEIPENIYFCIIDYTKASDCVDHNKLWKILRDENTRPPYLPPEKPVYRSRSNS